MKTKKTENFSTMEKTLPNTHLGREITFDHCRYIPVKEGFKIYYLSQDNMLGSVLDEIIIPAYMIDVWEEFLKANNDKIPSEKELEGFLKNTFLKDEKE